MATSTTTNPPDLSLSLSEETIDDLLYNARTGDLPALQSDVAALCSTYQTSSLAVLSAAIDEYSGNTIIHYAAANGHSEIISYTASLSSSLTAPSPATTTTLLTRPNTALSTPLHYAALNGHIGTVQLLLSSVPKGSGFNEFIGAKNAAGRDAAFEAESAGKEEVVTYLLGVMDDVEMAGGVGEGEVRVSAGEGRAEEAGEGEGQMEVEVEVEEVVEGEKEDGMDVDEQER